jgi:hypothetical protein
LTAFLLAVGACDGLAGLDVSTKDVPARATAGEGRKLTVLFHNPAATDFDADLSVRLLQTTSGTAVPWSITPWKRLRLLAGQTVVETAVMTYPMVKAETRFILQWLEGTNQVLGTTEVFVYPTNLLAQLKTLGGDEPLGVFDPADQLKPLLRALAVEFADLQTEGTDQYHGKLAIFGPFESKVQMRANLKDDIRALASRGVAVVWLLPPLGQRASFQPSYYVVPEGDGTIVVAAPELGAGLAERPDAQLNLLRLAEQSVRPTTLRLPETETSN